MKTYLNELHKHFKDNRSTNNIKNTSYPYNIVGINFLPNKLMKNKSGVFKNNCLCTNNINNNKNIKKYNSKKSTNNSSNKNLTNFKKKNRLNVTPFQNIKNEYILNLAMDNLNKYQENILLKENIGNNLNEDNLDLNNENKLNEINDIYNSRINNYYINKNNNNIISNKKYSNNQLMNKTQESFHRDQYFKNNFSYLNKDLLLSDIKNDHFNGPPNPESYIPSKTIFKNNSFNYRITNKNKKNNINFEKNYVNKFNSFTNKTFDLNNENSKQSNISYSNNLINKTNVILDKKLNYVLENLELKGLTEIFEQNYIFFDDLFLLKKEDFVEMNIPIGPMNRIINFIEKYKNVANTYDFEELKFFINKYKHILIDPNDMINIDNINASPLTNDKYKSTLITENNKNKVSYKSHVSGMLGKVLNMNNFNFEDFDTLRPIKKETQINKYINSKPKNKNRKRFLDENKFDFEKNNNKIINEINNLINITNKKIFKNNKKDDIINNDIKKNNTNKNNNNNVNNSNNNNLSSNNNNTNNEKFFTSRIKDKYNQFINLNDNNNENNENFFKNSLFNEFTGNNNNINEVININNNNETNNNMDSLKINKRNENNIQEITQNSSLTNENDKINNFISNNSSSVRGLNQLDDNNKRKNDYYSSNISSNISNDKNINSYNSNNINQNPFKNFENIFSEIENYQMNYEKMKKENDNRRNKINFLLEKKNRPNLQYLKMRIKNSQYYNDEDLKNESARDLDNELQKMNIQKDNNNQINSIKNNPAIQNYLKARNKQYNNPLIEEFNKYK